MKTERIQTLDADIARGFRRVFWIGVLQSLLCAALGALAGYAYALGWHFQLAGGWQ